MNRRNLWIVLILFFIVSLASCRLLREVTHLREVDFAIDDVSRVELAGIDLNEIRSYEDLRARHVARLMAALADNDVPLSFNVEISARNPDENSVSARLVEMDWTLLLEDRETISGTFEETVVIPPGETRQVAVPVSLDLLRFFQDNARDLVELALAISGQGGAPKEISIRASPVVQTRLGAIRYPEPIIIESREIGS